MTYKQGIPQEPGLYWHRETLESEANIVDVDCWIRLDNNLRTYQVTDLILDDVIDADNGYFCPAVPPEVE